MRISANTLLHLNSCTDVGVGICTIRKLFISEKFYSFLLKKILECIFLGITNVNKLFPVYCLIRDLTLADTKCSVHILQIS